MNRKLGTVGQRTGANLLFTAGSYAWSAVLLAITVPILVHGLGPMSYGVFALSSLLLGYSAVLDLGLTPALVRAIAVHTTNNDRVAIGRVLGTALTLLSALGLVGGAALFSAAPLLADHVLHLPPELRSDARFVLQLTALGFAWNMALTPFAAIPQGLQRLDVFSSRTVFLTTLTAVGQITAVKFGGGLRWVAVATLAVNLLGLVVFVIVSRRLLPDVSLRPRLEVWAIRQVAGFGAQKFISQLAWLGTFQIDRVIVAAYLPISQVTYYSIPVTITQKFTLVQAAFSTAIFPAASSIHAAGAQDRLQRLYMSAQKLMLVVALPLTTLFAILARPIMSTWLGSSFEGASAPILTVLAVGYGLNLLTGVPALIADATGRPHWTAIASLVSAAINVALTLILVPRLGAIGAAYALLISSALPSLTFIAIVQGKLLHIPVSRVFLEVVLRPVLATTGVAVYAILVSAWIMNFAELTAAGLGGLVVYATLSIVLGVLSKEERDVVLRIFPVGRFWLRTRKG